MRAEAESLVQTLMSLAHLERSTPAAVEAILGSKLVSGAHYGPDLELQFEPTSQFSEIEMTLAPNRGASLVAKLPKGNTLSAEDLLWDKPFGPNLRRLSQPELSSDFLSFRVGGVEIGIEVGVEDDSVRLVRIDWPTAAG